MSFVSAFAAAVPTRNKDEYVMHIREASEIFKKHGASRCLECWGAEVPPGEVTSFPLAVKCGADETVVIGFVEWPSKASHDENMPKVMTEMQDGMKSGALRPPPFDGKRLIFGGFDVIMEL